MIYKFSWGKRIPSESLQTFFDVSSEIGCDPGYLAACIAFETGRSFDPAQKNRAGSGAVGLIQFMPATAKRLGTSAESLTKMSFEQQLAWVRKYFLTPPRLPSRKSSLDDVYMKILWPAAVGKDDSYVLITSASKATYLQNKGLDVDKNGMITKKEAARRVRELYFEGLQEENCLELEV